MKNLEITIGWLYPQLMNIYGDIGNIIAFTKRCQWRGIKVNLKKLNEEFNVSELKSCDFLLMGGAQDSEQSVVNKDLKRIKNALKEKIEYGTPGIYICGGFQFLGNYYKKADGKVVDGIGIFDLYTENLSKKERLIGNMVFNTNLDEVGIVIGFENHGGRTYLGKEVSDFGKVIEGYGNNGEDKTEGARYKNSFGTYSHGPILPKNPNFTDYLIKLSLETKYKSEFDLKKLDNTIEQHARNAIAKRLQVEI